MARKIIIPEVIPKPKSSQQFRPETDRSLGRSMSLFPRNFRLLKTLVLFAFLSALISNVSAKETVEEKNEEKAKGIESSLEKMHKDDSENLALYTCLLILTVLTIWLFKHRRFRFFHETGLTLIFGLIVGLIMKLTTKRLPQDNWEVVPKNRSLTIDASRLPEYVRLVQMVNQSILPVAHYKLTERQSSPGSRDTPMEEKATFSPEIFFNILLPPIIFNAGYGLKRKNFFRNIGTIMIFAFLGTTISCILVGYIMLGISAAAGLGFTVQNALYFGALISATDPVTVLAIFSEIGVDVDLFAIVFGESALNDAVAIVLSQTVLQYGGTGEEAEFHFDNFLAAIARFFLIFFGSFGLGSAIAVVNALITKFTKVAEYPLLETSLFLLMSYLSFLVAEACKLTGIVAVLFCGITQAHYTFNNLSDDSKTRTKQFFEILNFLSENFIFTYIGVSLFTSESHSFQPGFIVGAFAAILLGRAAFIYPLSLLLNLRRKPKIPFNHMNMLVFSGLRGAIAFALAIKDTSDNAKQIIYTTTSLIVIFTVIFNGGFTAQMISWLGIKHGVDENNTQELTPQFSPVSTYDSSEQIGAEGEESPVQGHNPWDKSLLPRKWYNFDARFMKPLLTNSRPNLMETMPSFCLPLARLLTTTQQMTEGGNRGRGGSTSGLDVVMDDPGLDGASINRGNPPPSMSRGHIV